MRKLVTYGERPKQIVDNVTQKKKLTTARPFADCCGFKFPQILVSNFDPNLEQICDFEAVYFRDKISEKKF